MLIVDVVSVPFVEKVRDQKNLYRVIKNGEFLGFLVKIGEEWRPASPEVRLAAYEGGEADHPWMSLKEALNGYNIAHNREWQRARQN